MISLTRKSDYALVALSHLARTRETVCSARDISDHHKIPLPVLMNILKKLSREGIVASVRGAHGGYQLAVDPAEVSLGDFITALEGPMRLVQCADGGAPTSCSQAPWCPVQAPAVRIQQRLKEFLAGVTLAEIIGSELQAQSDVGRAAEGKV
ncbi:MAG TPA: Rrf2 family transcriptional regulator [Phycisphaerae bacterium]|nr:Rrf2 family transcriptional regulator [Phycisphaerae bacterium]